MSISFHYKPDFNLVISKHVGKTSDDQLLSSYKSFNESTDFNPSMNHLVDLRRAKISDRSSEVLQKYADYAQKKFKDISTKPKVAVIAPVDISFGLSRVFEAFGRKAFSSFEVFRSSIDALIWLGLPENLLDLDEDGVDDL